MDFFFFLNYVALSVYCSTASEQEEDDIGEDGNVKDLICNESNAE